MTSVAKQKAKARVKKPTRNFVAKQLRTDPKFTQKVIQNKRKNADPKDDYDGLDRWLDPMGWLRGASDGQES